MLAVLNHKMVISEIASVGLPERVQNTIAITVDAQESHVINYISIPILLFQACVASILCALRLCICFLVLFGIPAYYSSRASLLNQCTAASSLEQEIPRAAHCLSSSTAISGLVYPPGSTSSERLGSPPQLQDAWSVYLGDRVTEWKVLFTLACVLAT